MLTSFSYDKAGVSVFYQDFEGEGVGHGSSAFVVMVDDLRDSLLRQGVAVDTTRGYHYSAHRLSQECEVLRRHLYLRRVVLGDLLDEVRRDVTLRRGCRHCQVQHELA